MFIANEEATKKKKKKNGSFFFVYPFGGKSIERLRVIFFQNCFFLFFPPPRPFANFGIFPLNGTMVKKIIISWKKSTFRAFPPGESGRRALRARLPASHRVERRRAALRDNKKRNLILY